MYRSLTNFVNPEWIVYTYRFLSNADDTSSFTSSGVGSSGFQNSFHRRRPAPDIESAGVTSIPLEVSVHRVQEDFTGRYVSQSKPYDQKASKDDSSQEYISSDYKGGPIWHSFHVHTSNVSH